MLKLTAATLWQGLAALLNEKAVQNLEPFFTAQNVFTSGLNLILSLKTNVVLASAGPLASFSPVDHPVLAPPPG